MVNLVKINGCYSGLLCAPGSIYRNISLATPKALDKFENTSKLHPVLQKMVEFNRKSASLLYREGIISELFIGRRQKITLGLYISDPGFNDYKLFQEAQKYFGNLEEGIHRRLFFLKAGVEVSSEIESLPVSLYGALLAKIRNEYKDPKLENICKIEIKDSPFDRVETSREGMMINFSRALLEDYPFFSGIENK